jgi:hypothetical protein
VVVVMKDEVMPTKAETAFKFWLMIGKKQASITLIVAN